MKTEAAQPWWSHLIWVAAAVVLGVFLPAFFAGYLKLPRSVYLLPYVLALAAFLYAYSRWSGVRLGDLIRRNWCWGLAAAVVVGFFSVRTVLWQPASARPEGLALAFNLFWPGLVYGSADALFLSVFPITATWRAFQGLGWTERWPGRLATGALSLLASLILIGAYHLGYPEFRGAQVLIIIAGVGVQSLACLLAGNPLPALIPHAAMHLAAVLHGMESVVQLPPHQG